MIDEVDFMVGRQLRRRRRLMGLTQQELGAACGISFQQVQKYECANNRMSVAMLWRFACALEVEVSYFFAGAPRRHVDFRSESPPADAATAARAA